MEQEAGALSVNMAAYTMPDSRAKTPPTMEETARKMCLRAFSLPKGSSMKFQVKMRVATDKTRKAMKAKAMAALLASNASEAPGHAEFSLSRSSPEDTNSHRETPPTEKQSRNSPTCSRSSDRTTITMHRKITPASRYHVRGILNTTTSVLCNGAQGENGHAAM